MIQVFEKAETLPPEWDGAAVDNFALCRDYLRFLERVNPCSQRYVLFNKEGHFDILVHYRLKLNIFCYSRLKLDLPVTIIGLPCSLSQPGYSINSSSAGEISSYIKSLKGAKIILNAEENLNLPGFSKGYTLPACIMNINWSSFDEYLSELRSHYRYRYKKALNKMSCISVNLLKNNKDFSPKLYSLYEQVYNKSRYKLEKLPIEFFRQSKDSIMEFKLCNVPVAFVQYAISRGKMVFLFGGLDYAYNKEYDLYLNMLLTLVRTAIENRCTELNLGQTAEEIKCRLGALQEMKYLYVHHSNPAINSIASLFIRFLSYRVKNLKLTVLKG